MGDPAFCGPKVIESAACAACTSWSLALFCKETLRAALPCPLPVWRKVKSP